MNTPCCEPGCTAEVLCPVHQALADLRAKVEGLRKSEKQWVTNDPDDYNSTLAKGAVGALNAVLALFPEEKP